MQERQLNKLETALLEAALETVNRLQLEANQKLNAAVNTITGEWPEKEQPMTPQVNIKKQHGKTYLEWENPPEGDQPNAPAGNGTKNRLAGVK